MPLLPPWSAEAHGQLVIRTSLLAAVSEAGRDQQNFGARGDQIGIRIAGFGSKLCDGHGAEIGS